MQSAIIIYHSESLLEMQFLCLIIFAFVLEPLEGDSKVTPAHEKSHIILYVLIAEHIFAYFTSIFRNWEIA